MMKIVGETNTMVTKIKETILKVSINNQTMNATNNLGILEDLQYLIQSNMEDCVITWKMWTDFRVRVRTE